MPLPGSLLFMISFRWMGDTLDEPSVTLTPSHSVIMMEQGNRRFWGRLLALLGMIRGVASFTKNHMVLPRKSWDEALCH